MTLNEIYKKLRDQLAKDNVDLTEATDEQITQAAKTAGVELPKPEPKKTDPTGPTQPGSTPPANSNAPVPQDGAALQAVLDAVKGLGERIENVENYTKSQEKQSEDAKKSELKKAKQDILKKAVADKKISQKQADEDYKEFLDDEAFSSERLDKVIKPLAVNPAFKGNESGEDDEKEKIETGKWSPDKPWDGQKKSVQNEAEQQIATALGE